VYCKVTYIQKGFGILIEEFLKMKHSFKGNDQVCQCPNWFKLYTVTPL